MKEVTMRKFIYKILALALTFSMFSCYHDDSTSAGDAIGEIAVSGIENSYAVTSFVGEVLSIKPEVSSSEDLTYTWLLLDGKTGTTTEDGDTIQPTVISKDKDLDYEVKLGAGTYKLRFMAQAKSGYTVYKQTTLSVRTTFSRGFYILKETVDGNTDIDLMTFEGKVGNDILTLMEGAPMAGKPYALCPLYNTSYIDTESDKMTYDNAVCITTENGGLRISRTSDLKKIFDRSNVMYEEMDGNEHPYTFFATTFYNCMSTDHGLYQTYPGGGFFGESSGQYGLPTSECGGSKYLFSSSADFGNGALWDETNHSLLAFDYNLSAAPLIYMDNTGEEITQNLTDFECLHCGFCNLGSHTGLFVLRDKATSKRYLYQVSSSFSGCYLRSRIPLSSSSHMGNASYYATNGTTASYIYCVDGGKIYAVNFTDEDLPEIELKPEGIGEGETVYFIANQLLRISSASEQNFDYLVLATQKGDGYKLYFYNTNGGAPVGRPLHVIEGKGTVKSVRFVNDTSPIGMNAYYGSNMND